jgi:MFS family permease
METTLTRIWNRAFLSVFIANTLMYLGQWMVQPLITMYTAGLGATAAVLGFVAGAFAVTAIIFKVFAGPAIDVFNRKYVLACALVAMALSFFGFSISTNVPLIIAFRFLQGAAMAFTSTTCLTLAADALPQDRIGSGIGIFTLAQAGGQAIAPSIGLFVADHSSFRVTFAVAGVFVIIACVMALRINVPYTPSNKNYKIRLDNFIAIPALLPGSLTLMMQSVFCLINTFLVIYAKERGIGNIGLYFTVYAAGLFMTRPLFGKLSDKYGFVKIEIPAMCFFAASYFIISYARSLPVFLIAAFVAAFGYGASAPLINSLCMKTVPKNKRGAASSTSYIGTDLGHFVGPIIAAPVASIYGYDIMWRVMTGMIFLAMIVVIISRKRIKNIETGFIANTNANKGEKSDDK